MSTRPYLIAALVADLVSGCEPALPVQPDPLVDLGEHSLARVVDGDTIRVGEGTGDRVRIIGIDSPELSHDGQPAECGADGATEALRQVVGEQAVHLYADPRGDRRDQYGRLLAFVEVNGKDAGLQMLKQGHAVVFTNWEPGRPHGREYRAAEQRAQAAGRGLGGGVPGPRQSRISAGQAE